jgi:tetratricopeptide (TPR) repeat protein
MRVDASAELVFSAIIPTADQVDNIAGGALGRGIDAFVAKDYSAAIREFKRTAALSPYSDNAYNALNYLAQAQIKNGQPAEAEKTYKQAIKFFPSADGLHLGLGNLLFSEGRKEEALDHYSAAVKINPTVSQNRYSLGQGYLALNKYEDAEDQFKKVISMQPRDSGGYYALGQTYRMAGKLKEAQEQLDKALALKKDFTDVQYELGMLYAQQHQIAQAQEKLDIITRDKPELADDIRGKIYENSAPKVLAAYSKNLNLTSKPGTSVSTLDSSLATPGATKNFTVNFVFNKDMETTSIQNIANWSISRSTSYRTGGPYNWGLETPPTEVSIPLKPLNVLYDPKSLTATLTFAIAQNSSGNGTIDLSHLVFKFSGADSYGNSMDTSADEYNMFSAVV